MSVRTFPPASNSSSAQSRTRLRFGVLAWLCGLAVIAYLHRTCFAVALLPIQETYCLSSQQMAWALSAFFISYSVFQIPSGWIGDRWGTRHALTLFLIVWSAANGLMGLAGGFLILFVSRFVNGTAQAGIFPCSVNSFAKWFPESEKAMPSGLLGASMSIGAIIATGLTGVLLYWLEWQIVFYLYALPGLLAAAGFYWWFRDSPREQPRISVTELRHIEDGLPPPKSVDTVASSFSWRQLLSSIPMWLICGQQFFRAAGYIFFLSWFPTYLQKTRLVSVTASGLLTSLPLAGVVIGSSAGGILMDWIYRRTGSKTISRKGLAVTSLTAGATVILGAFFIQHTLLTVALISIGSLLAGLAGPAAYTVTIDVGGRQVATVFATMNMVGNIGATLTPIVFERVAAWSDWENVLLLMAGIYVLAAVCWLWIDIDKKIFP